MGKITKDEFMGAVITFAVVSAIFGLGIGYSIHGDDFIFGIIGAVILLGFTGSFIWLLRKLIPWLVRRLKARAKRAKELHLQRETDEQARKEDQRVRIVLRYHDWLESSPVDGEHAEAQRNTEELGAQLEELRGFLTVLAGRKTTAMLPTQRQQHQETLEAVRASVKTLEQHTRMWRERFAVLTAQQTFQHALRLVPPWLGGTPFGERPTGSEHLWPKKPSSIPAALAETVEALKQADAALVSMKKVEEQMAAELAGASREAKMHLQTLLERAQGLRDRLSTRLIECQTHEDRQRAYALIAKTPAGRLQAGTLDAFFPKDIDPIDTDLLMSVPQSFDLDDKLRELKAAVAHNVAAGAADHEVEATTQAPDGRVLPPRRPKTTR